MKKLLLFCVLSFALIDCFSQTTVAGKISDDKTGAAIPGATIKTKQGKSCYSIRSRWLLSTLTSYITLDNIIKERHLEVAHEGQRIHDLKRLKQSVDGYKYDADELVFPIPIREINTVGADILKQNDGY